MSIAFIGGPLSSERNGRHGGTADTGGPSPEAASDAVRQPLAGRDFLRLVAEEFVGTVAQPGSLRGVDLKLFRGVLEPGRQVRRLGGQGLQGDQALGAAE